MKNYIGPPYVNRWSTFKVKQTKLEFFIIPVSSQIQRNHHDLTSATPPPPSAAPLPLQPRSPLLLLTTSALLLLTSAAPDLRCSSPVRLCLTRFERGIFQNFRVPVILFITLFIPICLLLCFASTVVFITLFITLFNCSSLKFQSSNQVSIVNLFVYSTVPTSKVVDYVSFILFNCLIGLFIIV